ncbi:hypothetical protein SNEBB_006778 [Seison nebaliae]|nr:hypothetical protein SNEBB_006778 [Seison nebaliae]
MSNDFSDWYNKIPKVTRWLFTGAIIVPMLARMGFVSPMSLIWLWNYFIYKFQIWRAVTAMLFFPISPQTGFQYLLNLYFLYNYSTRLEEDNFHGKTADYFFLVLFNSFSILLLASFFGYYMLLNILIMSILYIWCQFHKDEIVRFWFGTQFKAMYLPWVYLGFNFILQGGGFVELMGIIVGHLYYFLKVKYPIDFGGRQFLETPQFLYQFLPNEAGGVSGFGQRPASNQQQRDHRQAFYGVGRRLDD